MSKTVKILCIIWLVLFGLLTVTSFFEGAVSNIVRWVFEIFNIPTVFGLITIIKNNTKKMG